MKRPVILSLALSLLLWSLDPPSHVPYVSAATISEEVPSRGSQEPLLINKTPTIPLGALRPAGEHLVRPREGVVERTLQNQGLITSRMTPQEIRTQIKAYYQNFAKQSSVWISPEVQARALSVNTEALAGIQSPVSPNTLACSANVQPVTTHILALAVDFGGNDTFTYYGRDGTGCRYLTATTSGPLKGTIPHPGPRDNNTIWYEPSKSADAKFYENLIFGYQGVGRVRLDLQDPNDHQPGINLNGYTVQDYFDHMAGTGNVKLEGTVDGWVTVDHSEGYYGAQGCSSSKHDGAGPGTRAQLVIDALEKFMQEHPDYYSDSSPEAFWRQYDANLDGIVDSLWIIHAGMGQEAGGGPQGDFAVWSHSSDLRSTSAWSNGYKVYDDGNGTSIVVGPYTMVPENTDLGVLVEEFGHNFFGLPDLYTNDIENSVGFWSIMSAGSWAGWLGGATPVGMPLWFRMIAQCGEQPCNWQVPLLTTAFNTPSRTVTIGQLENTPPDTYKGIRINLPDVVDSGLANRAGTGKGTYTGSGLDNLDITLDREIVVPTNVNRLSFKAFWEIEEDRDYGYVMVKDGQEWAFLKDVDGVMRDTNPNGNNLGHGLTGSGNQKLRFDFSVYRGKTVTLRFRYKTDSSTTGAGWWVDDLAMNSKVFAAFEKAVPPSTFPSAWANSNPGWVIVPTTQSYPNYYLVEWRTGTKYDRMLKTAYVKNLDDGYEWKVERVPYNIPGAVLYYCNMRYTGTYQLGTNLTAAPSIGPKYPLLIVDMNPGPMQLDNNGTVLDPRIASYDAALTLKPSKSFSISQIDLSGSIIEGPWTFASKPAVTLFDDYNGYYAGLFAGPPCVDGSYCYANKGGSAVIPAFGKYSTRITHYDGTPYPELYGQTYKGSTLGTGNPGDDGMHCGVRIQLLKKSADNKKATLRLNPSLTAQ